MMIVIYCMDHYQEYVLVKALSHMKLYGELTSARFMHQTDDPYIVMLAEGFHVLYLIKIYTNRLCVSGLYALEPLGSWETGRMREYIEEHPLILSIAYELLRFGWPELYRQLFKITTCLDRQYIEEHLNTHDRVIPDNFTLATFALMNTPLVPSQGCYLKIDHQRYVLESDHCGDTLRITRNGKFVCSFTHEGRALWSHLTQLV